MTSDGPLWRLVQDSAGRHASAPGEPHVPLEHPATLDGIDLETLALRLATPLHVYSARAIRQRIAELQSALAGVDAMLCYAVKANSNLAILRLMAELGVGADIVSGGELRRSLKAGVPPGRIVFSGVGKTEAEIDAALAAGIWRFNVESRDELETLERLAKRRNTRARAAARINPDVDAGSHPKISTGRSENKFGVSIAEARSWFAGSSRFTNVRLDGLHMHIGSQVLSVQPFRTALERLGCLWRELADAGHAIESIDVGGGLGVAYRAGHDRPAGLPDYLDAIRGALRGFTGGIVFEPGRWLVAEAGVLLTRVLRVKEGVDRRWLVVDAAMNDMPRPSLYDAWHDIQPLARVPRKPLEYDVVGPVCESGDAFARGRLLPECAAGDLLVIRATGAYGAAMACNYNSRPLAAEALVEEGRYAVVRDRQTFEDMIAGETMIPEWRET